MPRKQPNKEAQLKLPTPVRTPAPAAEAFSFLQEMRGEPTWTLGDMVKSLRIKRPEASEIARLLEIQGYVKQIKADEFMTTLSGEAVSGSKLPRFTVNRIDDALTALRDRIAENNKDEKSPYIVEHAVAFGDFLRGRARAQAAEVGVQLVSRQARSAAPRTTAEEAKAQQQFLKDLRGKGGVLNLRPLETWMEARTHRNLL